MTNPARLKYLADVVELVQALHLKKDFGNQLSPFVRDKYTELWLSVDAAPSPDAQS